MKGARCKGWKNETGKIISKSNIVNRENTSLYFYAWLVHRLHLMWHFGCRAIFIQSVYCHTPYITITQCCWCCEETKRNHLHNFQRVRSLPAQSTYNCAMCSKMHAFRFVFHIPASVDLGKFLHFTFLPLHKINMIFFVFASIRFLFTNSLCALNLLFMQKCAYSSIIDVYVF